MANAKVIISAQSELDKGLNKAKSQLQDFGKAASTIGNSISSMISKHAGIALLVGSITALGAAAKKCADEYIGVARENDRFEATMQNLTKTTGVQISYLKSLADEYEKTTFFTGEAVQAAGQLLLATNEISKDVFPRALEATIDLAEAMGQDLSSAASQMQKALAEPEEGLKALRTAGINFTDSEEELIKSLIESNKKLEAQELILKKVEDRYKGVAKAVADTPVGTLNAIQDAWGALKENIGQSIVDQLDPVFKWINTQLNILNRRLEERENIQLFEEISTKGTISSFTDYEVFKNLVSDFQKEVDLAQKIYLQNFNIMRDWGYKGQIFISLDTQSSELLEELRKYGIEVNVDQETGMFSIPNLDKALNIIRSYETDNPWTAVMGMTNKELLELKNTLVEVNSGLDANSADYKYNQSIIDYIDGMVITVADAVVEGAKDNVNSTVESIFDSQQSIIDTANRYLSESFLSTLDKYDREIYGINEIISELQTIDLLSPFYPVAKMLVVALEGEISKLEEARRLDEEAAAKKAFQEEQNNLYSQGRAGEADYREKLNKDAKLAGDRWREEKAALAETQALIDQNISFLDNLLLSSMDEYDRAIYGIVERINELASIDISSPLKEQANSLIEVLSKEIDRIRREQAAEEKKAAKSKQVKSISSDIGPAETEEDVYGLFLALDELAKIGTEEASEAMERVNEYIADFYDDLDAAERKRREEEEEEERKRREEEAEKKQTASDIWTDKGFRGMEDIFETLGEEMSLDDVFGGFFAEFGRTRELGFDSLLGPLDTLLGALDPILDIVLSSNPALAALLPIIEAFVNVLAPAIETTIAPLMDFLTEIGTALGEVFLPIFDALRPSLDMIAEILRMFITPVLQILEPIIGAVVLAFDMLSPVIAAVGLTLTPLAAALEFVMDMFGYLGEVLITFGENVGIAFYNITHWFNPKEFKTLGSFHSDAFDNFGEKMDKWFTMMEDDQVVSDSVSQQIATTNATYTGATTVHMNIYQNAPVVGENGMEQFAIMIRDKFEELNYFAA